MRRSFHTSNVVFRRSIRKFYVVEVGRTRGIFEDYEVARQAVDKYKNGRLKGFLCFDEAAKHYKKVVLNSTKKPQKATDSTRIIYTDGSSLGNQTLNTARGGVGIFYGDNDPRNVSKPLDLDDRHSSDRAELLAVVHALELELASGPDYPSRILIRADSQYAIQCLSVYGPTWKKNGFKKSSKKTTKVANSDLVKHGLDLMEELSRHTKVVLEKVEGHSSIHGNVEADKLARLGAKMVIRTNVSKNEKHPSSTSSTGSSAVAEKDTVVVTVEELKQL